MEVENPVGKRPGQILIRPTSFHPEPVVSNAENHQTSHALSKSDQTRYNWTWNFLILMSSFYEAFVVRELEKHTQSCCVCIPHVADELKHSGQVLDLSVYLVFSELFLVLSSIFVAKCKCRQLAD